MEPVRLTHLHEIPDDHLAKLIGLMARGRNTSAATAPRVAAVFIALLDVLAGEVRRRRAVGLPHSAATVTIPLSTTGELSETEMRDLMRWMLTGRTAVAGGTPAVVGVFDAVLAALQGTRTHQSETLAHLDQDLANERDSASGDLV